MTDKVLTPERILDAALFFILHCLLEQCREQGNGPNRKSEFHEHITCFYQNSKRVFR